MAFTVAMLCYHGIGAAVDTQQRAMLCSSAASYIMLLANTDRAGMVPTMVAQADI